GGRRCASACRPGPRAAPMSRRRSRRSVERQKASSRAEPAGQAAPCASRPRFMAFCGQTAMRTHITLLLTIVSLLLLDAPGAGQLRVRPVADQDGRVELALLLRKLEAEPAFMMTTAHPDDENNALLAQLDWGLGLRTTLV